MDLTGFAQFAHDSGVGEWMRSSLKALPIVNALHVAALATVFGTILIVDLRLLGFPNTKRPVTLISHELLRWTWAAFVLSAITGALMFTANAITYAGNTAFWLKMGAIALAGVNMAVFEFVTARGVAAWDKDALPPLAARAAGGLSILLWTVVIVLGRVIGFTKGYDFEIPDDVDPELFDFGALAPLHDAVLAFAFALA